jgi:hypothetical protein
MEKQPTPLQSFMATALLAVVAAPLAKLGYGELAAGQYWKAGGYFVIVLVAVIGAGMLVVGVIQPQLRTEIGSSIVRWLAPALSNPFAWLFVWGVMLLYLAGPKPAIDSPTLIVGVLMLGGLLFALVPAWLLNTPEPSQSISIQSPDGGKVPTYKVVRGFAYPRPELVQVFVEAGGRNNMRWFLQPDTRITRYEWMARCRFGDIKSVTGWSFRMCALIPKTRIVEGEIKNLPSDAIKSEIITVSLVPS